MCPRTITEEEVQRLITLKTYVLTNLHQVFSLKGLAQRAYLSQQKLREGFAGIYGMPLMKYIHEARMHTGAVLLKHTDKPIKEIAYLTGYGYPKNFMTAIKKFHGRPASQIRQEEKIRNRHDTNP